MTTPTNATPIRTINTIEREIELGRSVYLAAISHSSAMAAAKRRTNSACDADCNAAALAESEVDRAADALRTLCSELKQINSTTRGIRRMRVNPTAYRPR